jgi:FkbM family methyltransferase
VSAIVKRVARRGLRLAAHPLLLLAGKFSYGKPIILEDRYSARFVLYPWDAASKLRKRRRVFYREEISALERLVHPGETVFDVGANIGFHATLFSRWVGERGRVFSFEPVPDTAWRLRETLALNRCSNVEVLELALLDEEGLRQIHLFGPAKSDWNTFGHPRFGRLEPVGSLEVAVTTIDAFCEQHQIERIDLLKLDVEGFEKSALQGAARFLRDGRIERVSFEISKVPLLGSGTKPKEIFDLLESCGYLAYRFDAQRKAFVGPVQDSDSYYEIYYASRADLSAVS